MQAIKEYHPSSNILIKFLIQDLVIITFTATMVFAGIFYTRSKLFLLVFSPFLLVVIVIKFYNYLWYNVTSKRQPIIQIMEEGVTMVYPKMANFKRHLVKSDVKEIVSKKMCKNKQEVVGILFNNPQKMSKLAAQGDKYSDNLTFKLWCFFKSKISKTPISFQDFNSLKGRELIHYNIFKTNEQEGFHIFFSEYFYGKQLKYILDDFKRILE